MKTWNINFKAESADPFILSSSDVSQSYLELPLYDLRKWVSVDELFKNLERLNLNLSPILADFLNLTLAAYVVDQIVSRTHYGFQGWSRHLRLFIPVRNIEKWFSVKDNLEEMLSFLSGDKWELNFRAYEFPAKQLLVLDHALPVTKVALFSGGLDSFISSIDLLENGEHPLFISHYKRGTEGAVQKRLYDSLASEYGTDSFTFFRCYVQPNHKNIKLHKESSSRARSFLFLSLGVIFANAIGPNIPLVIPENGLIALNIPLTLSRLSSHSTRTTHPYYFSLYRQILNGLDITNPLSNPYQFKTKGEMMIECLYTAFLNTHYPTTLSCSHPDQSRRKKGGRPGINCGYCLPCIIRQAAEKKAGGILTAYDSDVKTSPPLANKASGRDFRAFKIALEKRNGLSRQSRILNLLRAGPLPFEGITELEAYLGVYERGMEEVNQFLS